jgi:hypothetical protein
MITNAIASISIKIPPRIRFALNCMRLSNKEDMSILNPERKPIHREIEDQVLD